MEIKIIFGLLLIAGIMGTAFFFLRFKEEKRRYEGIEASLKQQNRFSQTLSEIAKERKDLEKKDTAGLADSLNDSFK